MRITALDTVGGDIVDDLWKLYYAAFHDLNALAVQRHLMYRTEFDAVMADRRVGKWLAYDGAGELEGLSTFTNDLDAVPLISPDYFQRRWPVHFAEGRIWYVGFVATHPDHRGANVFARIIGEMYRSIAHRRAIVALDMCRFNDDVLRLSRVTAALLNRITGHPVPVERLDEQSYWLYDVSEPPS